MYKNKKVVVVLPAYNAALTLEKTFKEIPFEIVDDVILCDDASKDDTLEKAKEDFRFKLIADKLKKDPIKKETVITVQYYRIVTGSCELGVKNWIDNTFENDKKADVLKNGIKAKELLPILEKTNAYGLDKFKSLISF